MSIMFFEGFDYYGDWTDTEKNPFLRRELWHQQENIDGTSFQSRNNGQAMRLNTNITSTGTQYLYIRMQSQPNLGPNHFICGFAFMKESIGQGNPYLIRFNMDYSNSSYLLIEAISDTLDLTIRFSLYDYGGAGLIVDETVIGIEAGIWHYIEVDLKLVAPKHLNAWINGLQVVNAQNLTLTGWMDKLDYFYICAAKDSFHPGGIWYDDLYLLDASDASDGSTFQSRLGPISIRPVPLTGDGGTSQFAAKSGGARYVEVDEPGVNDKDDSFIFETRPDRTQLFTVNPIDGASPVLALMHSIVHKQSTPSNDVASFSFEATKSGSTYSNVVSAPLQDAYRLNSQYYIDSPDGTALNQTNIAATEFGLKSNEGT